MRIRVLWICIPVFLNACYSPPIKLDSPENSKEFGVVIARSQAGEANAHGMGNSVSEGVTTGSSGAGYTAASGAVNSASSGSLVPAASAATSTLGSIANAVTFGIFTTPVNRSGIDYTIRKNDGEIVHVIQYPNDVDDDPIFYPGQSVIIQTNGDYQKLVAPIR